MIVPEDANRLYAKCKQLRPAKGMYLVDDYINNLMLTVLDFQLREKVIGNAMRHWVAVWRDLIRYWVLNSRELESNRYFSTGQHRSNVGEGQLHLNRDNILDFAQYEVRPRELLEAIRAAYERLGNP